MFQEYLDLKSIRQAAQIQKLVCFVIQLEFFVILYIFSLTASVTATTTLSRVYSNAWANSDDDEAVKSNKPTDAARGS